MALSRRHRCGRVLAKVFLTRIPLPPHVPRSDKGDKPFPDSLPDENWQSAHPSEAGEDPCVGRLGSGLPPRRS